MPYNKREKEETQAVQARLTQELIRRLHGEDLDWVRDGRLAGFDAGEFSASPSYGLYNQRGLHWPPPVKYQNLGKT
jgi:hypothetical protein